MGQFEECGGLATARFAQDEGRVTAFVGKLENGFVVGHRGALPAGHVKLDIPRAFHGVGAVLLAQFEHRCAVEGLLKDVLDPGVADELEHRGAVAVLGGVGGGSTRKVTPSIYA